MHPPGIDPITLQLLPCEKLLEQACLAGFVLSVTRQTEPFRGAQMSLSEIKLSWLFEIFCQ